MNLLLALLLAVSLPDPTLTPGVSRNLTKEQICGTAWGKDVRHVTPEMKKQVCAEYHAANCPGPDWEIDHWIPRELAGADDIRNLWPQPIAEARVKDRIENAMHRAYCADQVTLEQAQDRQKHWYMESTPSTPVEWPPKLRVESAYGRF